MTPSENAANQDVDGVISFTDADHSDYNQMLAIARRMGFAVVEELRFWAWIDEHEHEPIEAEALRRVFLVANCCYEITQTGNDVLVLEDEERDTGQRLTIKRWWDFGASAVRRREASLGSVRACDGCTRPPRLADAAHIRDRSLCRTCVQRHRELLTTINEIFLGARDASA